MLNDIGKNIRKLRKERDLTQEELAEAINVTPQAISKWENGTGLPDISQIIPLATFFNVSSDILLGITEDNKNAEIEHILEKCLAKVSQDYSYDTWLVLQGALKKYPTNLSLLQESIEYGIALSYVDNDTYDEKHALEIYKEVIRQVDLITKYSTNANDILRAHMIITLLHASFGNTKEAIEHAKKFPIRADMIQHSMLAWINHGLKDYQTEKEMQKICVWWHFSSLMNNLEAIGHAYENLNDYDSALEVYFSILELLDVFFKEDVPPLHKFEDGNLYMFIARCYLKQNNVDECLKYLEILVQKEQNIKPEYHIKSKLICGNDVINFKEWRENSIENKPSYCLNKECFKGLKDNFKYQELINKITE